MGAAALADAILSHPDAASVFQPPAPAPVADHIPDATEMAPATYGARLRQCPTHGQQPANTWGCPACLRELREELARVKAPAADGDWFAVATIAQDMRSRGLAEQMAGDVLLKLANDSRAVAQQGGAAPAADGEREGLAQWLDELGHRYADLHSPSTPHLYRVAALLREPPQGEEDGPVSTRKIIHRATIEVNVELTLQLTETTTPTPPEGLTDEQLLELAAAHMEDDYGAINPDEYDPLEEKTLEVCVYELIDYARAAIAADRAQGGQADG